MYRGVKIMAKNEKTSPAVARLASRAMQAPSTLTTKQIKTLAASVLTQAPDHKKPAKKS
jgi:hypothetical protein